jgi:hypothetical protein
MISSVSLSAMLKAQGINLGPTDDCDKIRRILARLENEPAYWDDANDSEIAEDDE